MGRRETLLDPGDGPIARFAGELRKLRHEAGTPTYRVMAARAHYSTATLAQAAAGERLPSLPVTLAYVQACDGDPEHWRRRWEETSEEVLELAAAGRDDEQSPYLGLARFEVSDHERFFGRDALAGKLIALIRSHRLVLVVGPSGSGKSSLLRAGLIPRLQDRPPLSVRVITPGAEPTGTPLEPAGDVVIVDQFEEIFTLCGDVRERDTFIDALLATARNESGTRVVIAVRADFFGHCAGHRALSEAVQASTLLVGPMSAAELREAIVKPAATAGLIVERELTALLIDEVADEPGGLPLMSHALRETWRRRTGKALTRAAYEATGGIHAAVARTSEACYADLSPRRREHLRLLLLRLITPGEGTQDTRRPADRAELFTGDDDTELVLDRLIQARLITLDEERVDLAHEALLTSWPRLRGWIEEDRERMRLQRRLTEAARDWQDHDRDAGRLYRGARLSMACDQFAVPGEPDELTPVERAFLTTGIAARNGERWHRRRRTAAISILLVLTSVAAMLAWQQNHISGIRQREADARRAVGIAASLRTSDPLTAMRLSLAAWRLADLPETRSGLLAAAHQRAQDVFTDPGDDTTSMRRLSRDGRALISIGAEQVTAWDLRTRRRTVSLPGLGGDFPFAAATNGDAWKLPISRLDGVKLWDLTTGRRDASPLPGRMRNGVEVGTSGRSVIGYHADGSRYRITVWEMRSHRRLLEVSTRRKRSARDGPAQLEHGLAFLRSMANGRNWSDPAHPDATLSPDDRFLALCVPGEPLQLWDVAKGRPLDTPWAPELTREQCRYEPVTFTPDSRRLALVTSEKIRIWDIASGTRLTEIDHPNVEEIGFSQDGSFLVTADEKDVLLWRVANPGHPVLRHALSGERATNLQVDLHANRIRYLSGSQQTWPATVRTLDMGRAAIPGWMNAAGSRAAFSPDGTTVAFAYQPDGSAVIQVRLHDRRTGQRLAALPQVACPGPDEARTCNALLAFSSDGRTLAFGAAPYPFHSSPAQVSLWDVAGRRITETLTLKEKDRRYVGTLAFALGDASLVMLPNMSSNPVIVWDPRRRTVTKSLSGGKGLQATVSPDRRTLVTAEGDVIDLRSVAPVHSPLKPGLTGSLAFSADGRHLAASDLTGRIALWDFRLGERVGLLEPTSEHGANDLTAVSALAFSPDGGILAAGTGNGTLQLWDVASRRPIGSPLSTPGDAILALAFSADGRTVYAAGRHTPLQRYDIAPDTSAAAICRRADGGLAAAEWETYFPDHPYQHTCPPAHRK